jgi:hypothetical protein
LLLFLIIFSTGAAAHLPSSDGLAAPPGSGVLDPRAHAEGPLVSPVKGIATPCGLFLLATALPSPLLLLLPGHNIQFLPRDRPEYSLVDGIPLQATITSAGEMGLTPERYRGLDLLKQHQQWERAWLTKHHGRSSISTQELTSSETATLAWQIWAYSFPKPLMVLSEPARSILYLTIATGPNVLVIGAVLRQSDDQSRIQRLLEKAPATIEQFDSESALSLIATQIRSAARDATTCSDFAARLRSH